MAVGLPESLRHLLEQQLGQVSPADQRVLEAASVVGMEFSAAAVAAGVNRDVLDVEDRCAALARRAQFVQARGTAEWPDGTVAARYGFIHALYQEGGTATATTQKTITHGALAHRRLRASPTEKYYAPPL